MSLTSTDLQDIRGIVEDIVGRAVTPIHNEISALRNDIKEIYELLHAAKQAGIKLPR
jgi:hypothetical protein